MREYYTATAAEPHVILGVRLLPLTVGHALELERHGLSTVATPAQLATAILICSRPPHQLAATLADPLLPLKMKWWLWRASPVRWSRFWRTGPVNWAEKLRAWHSFFDEHTQTPATSTRRKGTAYSSRTPFLQHLKVTLQSKLNYSPAEALACPFVQAVWDYFTYHEQQGSIEIVDHDHGSAMREFATANQDDWIAEAIKLRGGRG